MKKFLGSKKRLILVTTIIIIAVSYFYFSTNGGAIDEIEIQSVARGNVKEIVSETGFVQPSREVVLAFERGGRVVSIPVKEGDRVEEGAVLIMLDDAERRAELTAAYARLKAEQVRLSELTTGGDEASLSVTGSAVDSAKTNLENAKVSLEKVIAQQNQLLANAEKTLRSSGLQAYLISDERASSEDSFSAPTISGTYNSEDEGLYRIELYNSGGTSGSSYRVSGLELGTEQVSTVSPTPVGTRGLYVQFPDNFANRTEWEIPIPNTRSAVYLANLNTYNATLENREAAIKAAENIVKSAESALIQSQQQYTQVSSPARDERVEAQKAVVLQMQAAVSSAQIALDKMTLKAPFTGIVTNISLEEGEIISPSAPAVSIISDENLELVVNISESDIKEVTVDDVATVIFDAYDDNFFEAKVIRIAPIAKMNEGVRVFEVTLQFVGRDERIKTGLSADIDLLAAERKDVIAVPSRAVVEREDGKFVRTWDGTTLGYISVQTGLRGSDGMTEIVSGLSAGDEIITFAREDIISQLESTN